MPKRKKNTTTKSIHQLDELLEWPIGILYYGKQLSNSPKQKQTTPTNQIEKPTSFNQPKQK